jgi:hypothetical protein
MVETGEEVRRRQVGHGIRPGATARCAADQDADDVCSASRKHRRSAARPHCHRSSRPITARRLTYQRRRAHVAKVTRRSAHSLAAATATVVLSRSPPLNPLQTSHRGLCLIRIL